jgi:tetratricopeptide (TPR) repeat protein
MFEWPIDAIAGAWNYLQTVGQDLINELGLLTAAVRTEIASFNPTQRLVLWIQFGVGILTIIWIIFQFAWMRRLNEARLERHLEGTISAERDELADERTTMLVELDRVVKSRGPWRYVLLAWAHLRLMLSLIMRLLSFGTTRGLADHNLLLMKVGAENRARAIFTEVAREAMKKIGVYHDAIENKTLEAQNALIFAGRVALTERRNSAAVALFKKAKNLRDDPDAHVLIGKQLAATDDPDGAMVEYDAALAFREIADMPFARSEAHRCRAEVFIGRGALVRARQELDAAKAIDDPIRNYAGLGRTQELIGDIWSPRKDRKRAAMRGYARAATNYDRAGLPAQAREARRKFSRIKFGSLEIRDGWLTRAKERCAHWLLRQVEQQRARARMTAV